MMTKETNVIKSFINIVQSDLTSYESSINPYKNRIQIQGERFEVFIKNSFANTFQISDVSKVEQIYSEFFIHQGSANHPPDLIIRNGDSIEMKKNESKLSSNIALNSSWPRTKLYSYDEKLTKKVSNLIPKGGIDNLYAVGTYNKKNILNQLLYFYGDCFYKNTNFYRDKYSQIQKKLSEFDLNKKSSKELGGISNFDEIDRSSLRIRGMFQAKNPMIIDTIKNLLPSSQNFQMILIMRESKYQTINNLDKTELENLNSQYIIIKNIDLIDPDNSKKHLDVKIIIYTR
tara:strand:- start:1108 stop:1971 length:864 start_codon:yes stop_codon:yes gene_type:complete